VWNLSTQLGVFAFQGSKSLLELLELPHGAFVSLIRQSYTLFQYG
jgi:hypothetical protein